MLHPEREGRWYLQPVQILKLKLSLWRADTGIRALWARFRHSTLLLIYEQPLHHKRSTRHTTCLTLFPTNQSLSQAYKDNKTSLFIPITWVVLSQVTQGYRGNGRTSRSCRLANVRECFGTQSSLLHAIIRDLILSVDCAGWFGIVFRSNWGAGATLSWSKHPLSRI